MLLVAVLAGIGVLALGRRVIPVFHGALLVILVGYAFMGKGFAYLGAPPLYVGEIVLALCLASIMWTIGRARLGVLHALLFLFMAWGAVRTIPYIGTYGIDALRDAATWVYGFFAIGVSLTVRPEHLGRLVAGYRRFIPIFLVWVPVAAVLTLTVGASLPTTPGSDVPIFLYKAGDMSVQLAGIAAFVLLGLYHEAGPASGIHELVLWGLWIVGAGISAALNRAAIVALAAVAAVVLFVRASSRWVSLFAVAALLMILATFLDPAVDVGGPRALSVDQVLSNLTSVFSSDSGGAVNQATKAWREEWWNAIVNYTVNGPYFWTGKGFGINLADADGFQVLADGSLRAPHSTNLEMLARAGVPGLVLWIVLQAGFAISLLRATFRSYRTAPAWLPVLGWVFVYWLAALIDGSFDVYLGGPQGGIWFWSVIGLGIAAIRLSKEHPDLDLRSDALRIAADIPATPTRAESPAAAIETAGAPGTDRGAATPAFAPPTASPITGTPQVFAAPVVSTPQAVEASRTSLALTPVPAVRPEAVVPSGSAHDAVGTTADASVPALESAKSTAATAGTRKAKKPTSPTAKVAAPTAKVAAPTAKAKSASTTKVAAPTAKVAAPTAKVAAPTAKVAAPTAKVAAPTAKVAAPTAKSPSTAKAKLASTAARAGTTKAKKPPSPGTATTTKRPRSPRVDRSPDSNT